MTPTAIHNSLDACRQVNPPEGIYLISSSNTVEAITTDLTLFFQKLWLYQGKAAAANGGITANTGSIYLGKSGAQANITATGAYIAGNIVTVTTPTAHGYQNGQSITHGGGTPTTFNITAVIFEVNSLTYKFRLRTDTADGPVSGTLTTTRAKYTPWVLTNADTVGMVFELPLGQKMRLAEIIIQGTSGDGVFYQFT